VIPSFNTVTSWGVSVFFIVTVETFFGVTGNTPGSTFFTDFFFFEVTWFTDTGWSVDSVFFTFQTIGTGFFTSFTIVGTNDWFGRTDGDVVNDGGFGGLFWNNTLWWIDSISRTSDTVIWV